MPFFVRPNALNEPHAPVKHFTSIRRDGCGKRCEGVRALIHTEKAIERVHKHLHGKLSRVEVLLVLKRACMRRTGHLKRVTQATLHGSGMQQRRYQVVRNLHRAPFTRQQKRVPCIYRLIPSSEHTCVAQDVQDCGNDLLGCFGTLHRTLVHVPLVLKDGLDCRRQALKTEAARAFWHALREYRGTLLVIDYDVIPAKLHSLPDLDRHVFVAQHTSHKRKRTNIRLDTPQRYTRCTGSLNIFRAHKRGHAQVVRSHYGRVQRSKVKDSDGFQNNRRLAAQNGAPVVSRRCVLRDVQVVQYVAAFTRERQKHHQHLHLLTRYDHGVYGHAGSPCHFHASDKVSPLRHDLHGH